MSEFFKSKSRSRLERKEDEEITKKTIFLGVFTVLIFILVIVFGLPLLVKLSIILGEARSKNKTEISEKGLPPLPPRIVLPFEATNSASLVLTGVAEPKVTVELLRNDVSLGKESVDDKGTFTFKGISLDKGENIFTAVASTEKEGNSELSKPATILYIDEAPELVMTNPSEDKLTVDVADFDVVGKSQVGNRVTVNGHLAMVDDEGGFKYKLQLNVGKNSVEIMVKDSAGNETKKTVEITYDI